jgi:hypothetical protein
MATSAFILYGHEVVGKNRRSDMGGRFVTGVAALSCVVAVGCSDALSPDDIQGTWELVSINGATVPGTVTWGDGSGGYISYARYILRAVAEELEDGSSVGSCRHESLLAPSDMPVSTDACEYRFYKRSQTLTVTLTSDDTPVHHDFALEGDEARLQATRVGSTRISFANDLVVYRKR